MTTDLEKAPCIEAFRKLHESGCFVLPNPWDKGSAKFLQHLGYKAVATTSAGFAFSQGLPDAVDVLSMDEVLSHIADIVSATSLPVNADFQSGYACSSEGVARNVERCIATGVAGLSIEDATGDSASPLYEHALSVERIIAAREAIDATKSGVILTARCEAWLVGVPQPFQTALDRLTAFAEAGADCLFAPGVRDPKEIALIVEAVAPKPVNVIVASADTNLSVAKLAALGVRRISVGSALARVAWKAFMNAARSIQETGTFDSLKDAAPFSEMNEVFCSGS